MLFSLFPAVSLQYNPAPSTNTSSWHLLQRFQNTKMCMFCFNTTFCKCSTKISVLANKVIHSDCVLSCPSSELQPSLPAAGHVSVCIRPSTPRIKTTGPTWLLLPVWDDWTQPKYADRDLLTSYLCHVSPCSSGLKWGSLQQRSAVTQLFLAADELCLVTEAECIIYRISK